MSLLVFPSLQNPPYVSFTWPIKQTPQFNTIKQMPASGRGDIRIPTREFPLWIFEWDISYIKGDATGTNTSWQQLVNFYMAVQGGAADWLFLHPFDNGVTAQAFATGDSTTTQFSIIRTFVVGGAYDLIQNFVNPPSIYDNGTLVNPANYSIDEYGTITFTSAPATGHTLTWTGQFYYRCCFEDDQWDDLEEQLYQIWQMRQLKFRSVLL